LSSEADVPLGGGDMGYVGDAGLYVQQSVIDAAQSAEGLALEYYKSYNASTLFERVCLNGEPSS